MKTIGINTDEQIQKASKPENWFTQMGRELSLKSMINSCFAYGGIDKIDGNGYNYKRYILPYKKELPDGVFEEVYNEQSKFLTDNCKVEHGVYTDSEGGTYNSIVKK